ncbi:hypothetical protein Tco_0234345, partial [Tanacetum coccineum]
MLYWLRLVIGKLLPPSGNLHEWGFAAALAVLIIRASQSRQHDTLVRLLMDIRLKIDLENQS